MNGNEAAFRKVVGKVISDKTLLPVTIDIAQAWLMVSTLQMATRHPEISPQTKAQIESIARQFQAAIVELHPYVNELIEMGWDVQFDS